MTDLGLTLFCAVAGGLLLLAWAAYADWKDGRLW